MQIPQPLYREILSLMPIACVDLMATNPEGDVLLVKRNNTPARDQWWFPGGRIFYQEARQDAVRRKLAEECNLTPDTIEELGTHSLQLERDDGTGIVHSITTVYRVRVAASQGLRLDSQSRAACWQSAGLWLGETLHPFIDHCLTRYGQVGDV